MTTLEELDAAMLLVCQKLERRTIAKLEKNETEMAKTQQELALACRAYNQLVALADDDLRFFHRMKAMADEMARQVA